MSVKSFASRVANHTAYIQSDGLRFIESFSKCQKKGCHFKKTAAPLEIQSRKRKQLRGRVKLKLK